MRKHFFAIGFCVLLSGSVMAQFGALKDKVVQKTKQLGKEKGAEAIERERNRLDSSDFNFAISVMDNSGMMNVTNAMETTTKLASTAVGSTTPEQQSRDILDRAEFYYQRRWFKMAEVEFLAAKLSYETQNITKNINYSKVNADLGLLYATMGRYNTAEYFTSEALTIREETLTKDSKAYASSLNN